MQLNYRSGSHALPVTVRREAGGEFTVTTGAGAQTIAATLLDTQTIQLVIDGRPVLAYVVRLGDARHVWIDGQVYVLTPESSAAVEHAGALAPPQIVAPMPGKVLQVLVEVGQQVAEGDGLVIVEAMKMEHRIIAAAAATVRAVHIGAGQMVDGGAILVELEYGTPA